MRTVTNLKTRLVMLVFLLGMGLTQQALAQWEETAKLLASDAAAWDGFGNSVALSGNTAIVGAPWHDYVVINSGAAYIFDVTTGSELAKLVASDPQYDAGFGYSVAISGTTAIVGALYHDEVGSAYLFDVNDPRNPVQTYKLTAADAATGDLFGCSVAISGNTAIVGAWGDDDAGSLSGSAYLYDFSDPCNIIEIKLTASDAAIHSGFGDSVAISGTTAIVGASGSAYLYDFNDPCNITEIKLAASDIPDGDLFGSSVAISGNTAIVGDYHFQTPVPATTAAYLFDVTTGKQLAKLVVSVPYTSASCSVGISGSTAIMGKAYWDAFWCSSSGATYLFDVTTGSQRAELSSDATVVDLFGYSVAISGNTAIVGARRDDDAGNRSGSAYVFDIRPNGVEKSFMENFSSENIFMKEGVLENLVVSGDFNSTLNFTSFEIVTIATGPWAGKGFSKGQWETTLDGISYEGDWKGVLFLMPEERKIYLKGSVTGEISATAEGYITESVPESGIYDEYQATWRIGRIGTNNTSATIDLDGILSYLSTSEFPGTELYVLQSNIEGTMYGHYSGPLSTVINHVRIADGNNPYDGNGFSVISYVSETGSGQGWTYDEVVSPGRVELKGLFTSPLFGIASGVLDESELPRTLFLTVTRVDLGLPPMADLEVKTWGPGRISPGQTINYVVEYRNDGLRSAENVIVLGKLPSEAEYISSTNGGIYKWETHEIIWKLGTVPPKAGGNLAVTVRVEWGLPWGTELSIAAIIDTISNEMDTFLNPEVAIYNLEEYLTYEPVDVVSANSLTQDQLESELTDPNFLDLYVYSLERGLDDINCPFKLNFSGLSTMVVVPMVSDFNDEIEFVVKLTKEDHVSYIIQVDKSKISFLDREGGFLFESNTHTISFWGEHHSCNWAQCVNDCLGEKIGRYGLEKALSYLTERLSDVFWLSYDCSACVLPTTPAEMRKKYCKACILDIPGAKEGWQIGKCIMDCLENVNSYGCQYCNNCYKCSGWWYRPVSFYAKYHCDEDCLWQLVLGGGKECENGTICRQISKCNAKCLPEDNSDSEDSVVAVARDPSVKYGPEGRVSPGQRLDYTVEYENEGEGIAFGVYFTDTLDEALDDSTLEVGPVIDVNDGSIISGPGTYNPATRTISWFAGEVGPGEGGYAVFDVNVVSEANDGTEIINYATIYFPSVPEETRTNGIVSIVSLNQPPVAICRDVTVAADDNCQGTVTPEDVNNGSFDPDGDQITLSLSPSGPYPLGTTTVTLTVTDDEGEPNTCSTIVTVVDTTPPVITCPPDMTLECPADTSPSVTGQASATDACGSVTITYSDVSVPGCGDTETITRTWTATDECGNSSSCVQMITVVDTTAPEVTIVVPQAGAALQDGVTLTAEASDLCGSVVEVYFYLREPGGTNGVPIGYEDLPGTLNTDTGKWEYAFDTTQLLDGYYVILAKAKDDCGNEGWSAVVAFSIRNWAVIELLPASESNKAGRTMPVKFALRIVESVDPAMPFVYNEGLEIKIYDAIEPGNILQTSVYGDTSRDYRIDSVGELYITNFKTKREPAEYVVEIWRISKNFLVGSFTFETVK